MASMINGVVELSGIEMPTEGEAAHRLFTFARRAVGQMNTAIEKGELPKRVSLLGRVRGTGPCVSFSEVVEEMERAYPMTLKSPFEGSDNVAGAVLHARDLGDAAADDAFMKLRFSKGATDLPMHSHEKSARFIVVMQGRGFHHVSPQHMQEFDGENIRTVPIRERDALIFSPGVIHTFSAPAIELGLLSFHAPFVPLNDADQYTVPAETINHGDIHFGSSTALCGGAWTLLTGQE